MDFGLSDEHAALAQAARAFRDGDGDGGGQCGGTSQIQRNAIARTMGLRTY